MLGLPILTGRPPGASGLREISLSWGHSLVRERVFSLLLSWILMFFWSESFWDSMENLVICCDWISLNNPIKKKKNPKSTWVFRVDISLRYIIRAGYDHCMYSSYQGLSVMGWNWKDGVIGPWALYAWFAFDEKQTKKILLFFLMFESEVVSIFRWFFKIFLYWKIK